jgi:anti-sigma regulatory factor (Ser/Thr protein kinase)
MTVEARFPRDPSSPAAARKFVTRVLAHCPPLVRERAILMVSELATNAVQHGRSSFTVAIDETPEGIRVEVRDKGPGRPEVGAPTLNDVSGRGLFIVRTLSLDFGIETAAGDKMVWFTLSGAPEDDWVESSPATE